MSHTNKITFSLPSKNKYKESISKLKHYVDLSRYKLMVHLMWHHYDIRKLGKLKHDFMSHTNEIRIIVSKTRNAIYGSVEYTHIVSLYDTAVLM